MVKIDVTKYWLASPPQQSPGLIRWIKKCRAGWRPNRRISCMGYHEAAEWYNVYIWEYWNVIRAVYDGKVKLPEVKL